MSDQDGRAAPAGGESQEPSIEDILSSIRRMLLEDGDDANAAATPAAAPVKPAAPPPAPKAPAAAPPKPAAPAAEEDFDIDQALAMAPVEARPAPMPAPAAPMAPPPPPQRAMVEPEPEPEPEPELEAEPEADEMVEEDDDVLDLTPAMVAPEGEYRLVSDPVARTSKDVLSELARAILDRRDLGLGKGDITLEAIVREMLRPLLREWLDRNLPYLIERLVKKEIDLMINRAERLED